jgi:hypothetical protein
MMNFFRLLLALLMIAGMDSVAAQPKSPPAPLPPVESVVVTGIRSPQALYDYVGAVAAPTRLAGKMARWEVPVCPIVMGLNPTAVQFITRRLREVAAGAGAPVNGDPKCRPNIQIVFTTAPQALVDDIRKKQGDLLGYFDTLKQLDELATVTRPIQAWYMTATRDVRGQLQIDTPRTMGIEMILAANIPPVWLPQARAFAVTNSRLGDGLRANLHHVTIIADPTKLLEYEMGPVADYVTMLALSQMVSPGHCQSLPTITNLLAEGCPRIPGSLSDIDLGYLRGLYHMNAERHKIVQIHEVTYQMRRELAEVGAP